MTPSQPLTGSTPAARAGDTAAPARSGQVPRGVKPLTRLCYLGVRAVQRGGVDHDATAAEQRRVAGLGFGVALGIDARECAELGAQRFEDLVRRTGALGLAHGFAAGASCDSVRGATTISEQLEATVQQAQVIEEAGGVPVLLPLAALSRRRVKEEEYVEVYRTLLARVNGPVIVDWSDARTRPELFDYFPGASFERVMALDAAKVRGARFALLDMAREARVRHDLLARDQLLFTADRRQLANLLLGANPGAPKAAPIERYTELAGRTVALGEFSHAMTDALMGNEQAFAKALERLEAGDAPGFLERMAELR
jgi:hypothetical protein